MINLFICIVLLILGIILARREYKWKVNIYKNTPIWIETIVIIGRIICFILVGFFLAESIKYFCGVKTLVF